MKWIVVRVDGTIGGTSMPVLYRVPSFDFYLRPMIQDSVNLYGARALTATRSHALMIDGARETNN